jgi:aryl-alcohol dehydrogenase-like predicted oxidoreductase
LARAVTLAEQGAMARFEAVQVEYNLTERTVERELVPMSEHLGLSILAWGPLAGGLLSGKYQTKSSDGEPRRLSEGDRRLTERNLAIATGAARVAEKLNVAPAVVALAWLRARAARPIPILGVRTVGQLEALLGCLRVELPPEALEQLDRASALAPGYPHEFLERIRETYAARLAWPREEASR